MVDREPWKETAKPSKAVFLCQFKAFLLHFSPGFVVLNSLRKWDFLNLPCECSHTKAATVFGGLRQDEALLNGRADPAELFHGRNFFLIDAFLSVTHRRLAEMDIADETGDAIGLGRVLQLECDEMK